MTNEERFKVLNHEELVEEISKLHSLPSYSIIDWDKWLKQDSENKIFPTCTKSLFL